MVPNHEPTHSRDCKLAKGNPGKPEKSDVALGDHDYNFTEDQCKFQEEDAYKHQFGADDSAEKKKLAGNGHDKWG